MSFSKHKKLRLSQSFETFEQAKQQASAKQNKTRKNHIGSYSWLNSECFAEVENYEIGTYINFTKLSQKFQMKNKAGALPSNSGQVVKEFLEKKGIDLKKFDYKGKGKTITRRSKRRINGTKVSMPTEPTNKKIKQNMKTKISSGDYTIGELITPQSFEILKINNDNSYEKILTELYGRKIPLIEIRKKFAEQHKKFFRLHSTKEFQNMSREDITFELTRINEFSYIMDTTTELLLQKLKSFSCKRHLQLWHDGSTINNHAYVLFMVNCLYDPAIYLKDDEYFTKYKEQVNVQSIVEKPELYILARCQSSDAQLLYTKTRHEDNRLLKYPISVDGILLFDEMRFFHGDAPAYQLEIGQQKGGEYPCWLCPINIHQSANITHSFIQTVFSVQDRIDKILSTNCSKEKICQNRNKLYKNLKKYEIVTELHERGKHFYCKENKSSLQIKLDEEMHGIQRLPSLLYQEDNTSMKDLNLDRYEVLPCKPLHDIKGHISNLYDEIGNHLSKDEKKYFKDMVTLSFDNKECKRGVNYRKSLLKLVLVLKGKIDQLAFELLSTMVNIQSILYSNESTRSIENICFLHTKVFFT